jgi:hypothetical protein
MLVLTNFFTIILIVPAGTFCHNLILILLALMMIVRCLNYTSLLFGALRAYFLLELPQLVSVDF